MVETRNISYRIKRGYEKIETWKKEHPNHVGKIPNPFFYGEIEVFTDVESFESPYGLVMERDYTELGDKYAKWVETTQYNLLANRTKSELMFSRILSESNATVIEQPYFNINKKGYFLDFYLPQYGLAFELNGKVHKGEENEWYDIDRDLMFHAIGIKTIRLSNLDIQSPDIKNKLNGMVRLAMNGNFDPSLYYNRSNARKFDGKDTLYERLHKKINKALSKEKYKGKSILIITSYTYFCSVLRGCRYDTSDNVNKECIDEFFDIVERNNLRIGVLYNGNLSNMNIDRQSRYVDSNNMSTKRRIDYQIVIDGNDIKEENYPYKDVHHVQYGEAKDKNGDEHVFGICPYEMFFPFKKKDARKGRFKKKRVFAGSILCSMCQFCKEQDKDRGIILCTGFLNKDSKNIYDNLNTEDSRTQQYIMYKNTDEYKTIINWINQIDNGKKANKEISHI